MIIQLSIIAVSQEKQRDNWTTLFVTWSSKNLVIFSRGKNIVFVMEDFFFAFQEFNMRWLLAKSNRVIQLPGELSKTMEV